MLQGRFRLNLASARGMSLRTSLKTLIHRKSQGKRASKRRFDRLRKDMKRIVFRAGSKSTWADGEFHKEKSSEKRKNSEVDKEKHRGRKARKSLAKNAKIAKSARKGLV